MDKKDLEYFYPTSVLVTAPEIIFFWVARMIMAGMEFMKAIPFRDVYIHGTVRDIEGKKMSKSLGNIIDPLEIINEYGTDALRFSLISITAQGQDVYLSKERFEQGRNYANKIWNASRLVLMNLDKGVVKTDLCEFFKKEDLNSPNRWILSRWYSTLKDLNRDLDNYLFNEAANLLYSFFWHEFCDWYLEMIKLDIKNPQTQLVLYKVLEKFLRTLHPFMPFITEEIWQKLYEPQNPGTRERENGSIMIQPWPHLQENIIDKKIENKMEAVFETITAIRNMRSEMDIPVQMNIKTIISTGNKTKRQLLNSLSSQIRNLSRLSELAVEEKYTQLKSTITTVVGDMHISIPLSGIVDVEKEKAKLDEKIKKTEQEIKLKENTLGNKNFVKKAPEEIVAKEKEKLKELKDILTRLKVVKNGLQ
jgi:valyl-tRNA synthetase